ncbi:MAG: putative transport protein, partial [Rubritepida sp.]|nr:putative transport protein [Rubritepida sp.]
RRDARGKEIAGAPWRAEQGTGYAFAMHAVSSLLATLVAALALAFGLGLVARLLRLPPLLGCLAAGLLVGPCTPGFIADRGTTSAMAGFALQHFQLEADTAQRMVDRLRQG